MKYIFYRLLLNNFKLTCPFDSVGSDAIRAYMK